LFARIPSSRASALLVLASLSAAPACKQEAPAPAAQGPVEVVVVETKAEDVPIYAEFIGTLDGNVNAEVRARVPGYVTSVDYKEGAPVKAGQVLFTIDPVLAQAKVTQAAGEMATAQASLAKADRDVERLKPLVVSNAVSRQELDNALSAQLLAKAQVTSAEGSLQTARANLGFTKVTAPIDGIAGLAKVRTGNLVGQVDATLLTTVSQLDPVRARFTISEQLYLRFASELQRIATDPNTVSKLELTLADGSVYAEPGRLAIVDRQIDPTTGTLTLEALFPNPKQILRPGQYAKVRTVTELRKGAVVIPQRAVRELQGMTQVFVVGAGEKVELRTVTMGPRVGSNWVVEGGVKPGERVVVEGLQKVRAGAVVAPTVVPVAPSTQPMGQAPKPSTQEQ
jgi:membrane fusion protein (multidrug efflux system)